MNLVSNSLCTSAAALVLAAGLVARPAPAAAGPNPYIGDIISVPYTFCPRDWAEAGGQLLPISSHTALFSLFGTTYGGDGRTNFALPDLRGRVAMHTGRGPGLTNRPLGQKFGSETQVLNETTLPSHSHAVNANNLDGDKPGPGSKLLAAAPEGGAGDETIYSNQGPTVVMNPAMIANTGGSQPVATLDPFLVLRYCVALVGTYPSRP